MFYLPGYSPELNPDELLNGHLKQALRQSAPKRTARDLKKFALGQMRRLHNSPARVRAFFAHPAVRYAA